MSVDVSVVFVGKLSSPEWEICTGYKNEFTDWMYSAEWNDVFDLRSPPGDATSLGSEAHRVGKLQPSLSPVTFRVREGKILGNRSKGSELTF